MKRLTVEEACEHGYYSICSFFDCTGGTSHPISDERLDDLFVDWVDTYSYLNVEAKRMLRRQFVEEIADAD